MNENGLATAETRRTTAGHRPVAMTLARKSVLISTLLLATMLGVPLATEAPAGAVQVTSWVDASHCKKGSQWVKARYVPTQRLRDGVVRVYTTTLKNTSRVAGTYTASLSQTKTVSMTNAGGVSLSVPFLKGLQLAYNLSVTKSWSMTAGRSVTKRLNPGQSYTAYFEILTMRHWGTLYEAVPGLGTGCVRTLNAFVSAPYMDTVRTA